MSSMLRSIARTRAKENMRKKGFRQFCKNDKGVGSVFADNWRDYANAFVIDARRKRGVKA